MKRLAMCCALVLALCSTAFAESSWFSGFEIFPGISLFGMTLGATFSGWTNNEPPSPLDCKGHQVDFGSWEPLAQTTHGFVSGSVNYTGTPGFPKSGTGTNAVTVKGGKWSWIEPDGTSHSGRVLSGSVTWPANQNTPLGSGADCGCGVAYLNVEVGLGFSSTPAGTFTGCLNDQTVLPPRIWGNLDLPSAP